MNNLSAKLIIYPFHFSFFLKLAGKIFTMEAAKKGKKTSKPKKSSKPKKKNKKNNSMSFFTKFMLIILLLAVLTASVFVLLETTNQKVAKTESQKVAKTESQKVAKPESQKAAKPESQKVAKTESQKIVKPESQKVAKPESQKAAKPESKPDLKKSFKEQQNLNGCWLSTEQGASLTIDNYGYRIDFFGVDASAPMTGMIIIKDNSISFISDGRDCKNEEGSYKVTFDKKNIRLVCKKDDCSKRRNILEADWEWMEL